MSATVRSAVPAAAPRAAAPLPARLRIGTRRSALAMTQTRWLADRLSGSLLRAGHEIEVELVEVTSQGDVTKAPLSSLGGSGVFVSALREALLDGRIDLAVHSLKDMPTAEAHGLTIAAIPVREDPSDVLVSRDRLTLAQLPGGSRIGTGSPRRAAQLRALGYGLEIADIRGNVDTRLRMVAEGVLDGVLLAHAGLLRLGLESQVTQVLDSALMLPAPGQGALAAEARADDLAVLAALAGVDDRATRACVLAERALLARLEAGCAAPVGALAVIDHEQMWLQAVAGALDGSVMLRRSAALPCPGGSAGIDLAASVALGESLADELLMSGAAGLMPGGAPSSSTSNSSAPAREGEP